MQMRRILQKNPGTRSGWAHGSFTRKHRSCHAPRGSDFAFVRNRVEDVNEFYLIQMSLVPIKADLCLEWIYVYTYYTCIYIYTYMYIYTYLITSLEWMKVTSRDKCVMSHMDESYFHEGRRAPCSADSAARQYCIFMYHMDYFRLFRFWFFLGIPKDLQHKALENHKMPYLYRLFFTKEPIVSGSFAASDLYF